MTDLKMLATTLASSCSNHRNLTAFASYQFFATCKRLIDLVFVSYLTLLDMKRLSSSIWLDLLQLLLRATRLTRCPFMHYALYWKYSALLAAFSQPPCSQWWLLWLTLVQISSPWLGFVGQIEPKMFTLYEAQQQQFLLEIWFFAILQCWFFGANNCILATVNK